MQSAYKSAPLHWRIWSRHAAPGALTVTFVDPGEIRAVALRQRSGKFYEELSAVGARDAREQERISQAVIHGPEKPPSLYRSAPCLICVWAVNKS